MNCILESGAEIRRERKSADDPGDSRGLYRTGVIMIKISKNRFNPM